MSTYPSIESISPSILHAEVTHSLQKDNQNTRNLICYGPSYNHHTKKEDDFCTFAEFPKSYTRYSFDFCSTRFAIIYQVFRNSFVFLFYL